MRENTLRGSISTCPNKQNKTRTHLDEDLSRHSLPDRSGLPLGLGPVVSGGRVMLVAEAVVAVVVEGQQRHGGVVVPAPDQTFARHRECVGREVSA